MCEAQAKGRATLVAHRIGRSDRIGAGDRVRITGQSDRVSHATAATIAFAPVGEAAQAACIVGTLSRAARKDGDA